MKLSKILLTVLAGAALVMLAKSIRRNEAAEDGYFHDAYPDPALADDDDFRHLYPDNPVHAQDDTDHPMFV